LCAFVAKTTLPDAAQTRQTLLRLRREHLHKNMVREAGVEPSRMRLPIFVGFRKSLVNSIF